MRDLSQFFFKREIALDNAEHHAMAMEFHVLL
jgi:hypothetical protein